MMEPPGGTALVEESIAEALDFRGRRDCVETQPSVFAKECDVFVGNLDC